MIFWWQTLSFVLVVLIVCKEWHFNRYARVCQVLPSITFAVRRYRGEPERECVTIIFGWLWWYAETWMWDIKRINR